MKNLFKPLTVLGLTFSLALNAQNSSTKSQTNQLSESSTQEAKSAYLANQDYLSASSSKAYKNSYGDSLKGFDENKAKTELLSLGIYGQEFQGHILHLKREFINKKYSIGPKPVLLPDRPILTGNTSSNLPSVGGKPISGNNTINLAPCVNEDFESTTAGAYTTSNGVTGWTITSKSNANVCPQTGWTAGSPEFSIIATPVLGVPFIGTLGNSPLGGNNVAQLNDFTTDYQMTRITQTFPVSLSNTLFQIAYAGVWQDGGSSHVCCAQPGIDIKMYDCLNAPLACSSLSLAPGPGCQSSGVTYSVTSGTSWSNWQVKYIDLTPYVGTCVTIEIVQADCAYGGHYGTTYFDAMCGGQLIGTGLGGAGGNVAGPVSFCAGSNMAQISAPLGYSSYQWFAPGTGSIAAPQGTMANLTITGPIPNSVYTVQMVAPSGCIFTSTNAITVSTVNIAGIGSTSTCPGGASGSATVAGNGSGTGYNYTWINASNSATVGTLSIVNNLAPGVYSVILTGLGSAGCGSAVSTVTINTAPPGVISLLKPFCNNEAYLGTTGGTNFQWYNNLTAITASAGGTQSSYTVTSPSNGAIYWLSYLSNQGCQDSVKFTLLSSTPGVMTTTTGLNVVCPGGSTGSVTVIMSPAPGAPPGLNSYSVYPVGTNTAAYTASLFPTSSNSFAATGMTAGTYSVKGFDGSCKYGAAFTVNTFVYNYTVSPINPTLCPGNSIASALTFTSPPSLTQYSYSWTPSTFLAGNNAQSTIISPSTPVGTQTTIVYTVVVTPSLINCPIAKTISITAVSPPTPTISIIPPLCNTSNQYPIVVSPVGGTFVTNVTGTNNPITSSTGILTPSLAPNLGLIPPNSFTYAISVNTCVAKSTASYQVSIFNTAALSSSVPPLCVTSSPFNLMNIVQSSVNGDWLTTTGVGANSNLFNPSGLATGSYPVTYTTTSTPNPAACPHFTTINISVTALTSPTIVPVPEFCTNSGLGSMTVTPAGGGWLPNTNSALSNNGVITWTNVPVPSSNVTYTVADGPCINTASTTLFVSRFYPAGFTSTVNNLCYNSAAVNLMSIVQSTINGSWPAPQAPSPASLSVISNSFFPSNNNLPTGVYTLTYTTASFPNAALCPDSRTINISVSNPSQPVITQLGPICNNYAVMQLSVTPNTGVWTASPFLNNSGVFSPSLSSVGSNAVQYIIGTSTCNRQETKFINVEAFVPATIVNGLGDLCNTSPVVNLQPLTMSSLGNWSGPGITGSNFNPATTGSGNFILIHNTSSSPSGLCPDQATVAVNIYSLATPVVTKVGPFCNSSQPVQLEVSPVGGIFGGPSLGVVTLAGKFNPASAFIGENLVNYSITSGPCVAYAQATVIVEQFVSADFAKPVGPFCKSADAVNINSYAQNPSSAIDWESEGLVGTMFTPSIIKMNDAKSKFVKIVHKTYSSPTASLCPDEAEVLVEVRENPVVTALSNSQGGCAPIEVLFNTPNVNSGTGTWNFGDGSEIVNGFEANHIYFNPGSYTVTFSYVDDIGCEAIPVQVNPVVKINEVPKVDFTVPDEIYISDPQVQLTNLTSKIGDNKYDWKITGLANSSEVNPIVTFPKIGKYQVTLTATSNKEECKDQMTKTIEVKNNFNIYIPNSFSPNFDGLNDIFIPVFSSYGLDTKSFEMEIFDRWGHSIYHTKDASKGWDGSIQNKGEPLKEEVYIYRIKYKDLEGNAYNKMGHVSLVK
jgi:gliding motility-associated-like protein